MMSSFMCQALLHASVACRRKLVVDWVAAGDLEDVTAKEVCTNVNLPYCQNSFSLFVI